MWYVSSVAPCGFLYCAVVPESATYFALPDTGFLYPSLFHLTVVYLTAIHISFDILLTRKAGGGGGCSIF